MSLAQKGRKVSCAARRKLRKANLGKTISEETKQKIRKSLLRTQELRAAKTSAFMKGRPKSEAHKRNISKALKGHVKSPEHRRNIGLASIRNGNGRYIRTETTRKKLSRSIIRYMQSNPNQKANTKIELNVRNALKLKGIKFLSNIPVAGFLVDIYLPELKTVVECDGCFWHACLTCNAYKRRDPIIVKYIRNRDAKRNRQIRKFGYRIVRLWQHSINRNLDACIKRILCPKN